MTTLLLALVLSADAGVSDIGPDGGYSEAFWERARELLQPGDEREGDLDRVIPLAAWRLTRPEWTRGLFSARICLLEEMRTDALKEIATERKYSAIGGAVDLVKLHRLQQDVRAADDRLVMQRALLKDTKLPPLSCSKENVRSLVACIRSLYPESREGEQERCDGEQLLNYRAMEVLSWRRGRDHTFAALPWAAKE
jgi:hypothetical protein